MNTALPQPAPPGPRRKPRVAVVFGGRSGEHPISCVTAAGVLRAIDRDRYDVVPIGITRSGRWVPAADDPQQWSIVDGRLPHVPEADVSVLPPLTAGERQLRLVEADGTLQDLGTVDVVFPLLHGPFGEDGTLQGMLELTDIRYVGSGVLASAVGMDKHFLKMVLASTGLPVAPFTVVPPGGWQRSPQVWEQTIATLGLPVFVKPARGGSSLGISRVDEPGQLDAAMRAAMEHDPKVLVEAAVPGREIECAVLGGRDGAGPRTSLPGEIAVTGAGHDFYDFEAKYLDGGAAELHCPADLPESVVAEVQRIAARAFEAVGCEGLARVDTFVTPDGEVVVNEINTMPGFTPISMYPRMWQESGLSYPELIDELIQLALHRPTGLR